MRNKFIARSSLLTSIPICIIIFIGCAFADTVKLKNGKEFRGHLKEITDKDVVLELKLGSSKGIIGFKIIDVENINNLSIEEARARLSTEGAFISGEKEEAILSSAKEGLNFISKTRKLEFKNSPDIKIVSKNKIKENIKKQIEKYYTKERLDTDAKLLLKLGLISEIEDYETKVLGLLTEEIAGYYTPDDKKIYVTENALGEIMPGIPSISIMHEQVHALQDQHHDLTTIHQSQLLENADKSLAVQSVIEGEATVLMYDAFFRSMRGMGLTGSTDKFDLRSFVIDSLLAYSKRFKTEKDKPAIFMENLLFPYVWGGSFIQYTVNAKGWEEVDLIYIDMPASSEQIMHPEKYYIVRDEPKKVDFPDLSGLLGSAWIRLSKDTLGEFSFYLIGKVFLDELSTKMMSEGWGGDGFELYEEVNSKKTLFLVLSKWDSERDADEFFSFYKKIIEKKYAQPTKVLEDQNFSQWKAKEDNIYIAKSKDSVVIIEGAPDDLLSNLIAALKI